MAAESEYLRLSSVTFGYKPEQPVFSDFSLSMSHGEGVIVSGPVGSGKTTLVNLIIGRLKPQSGEIGVRGISVGDISGRDRARLLSSWGVVLEDNTLLHDRSIGDNIGTAVRLSAARMKPERLEIDTLLSKVRLAGKRKLNPSTLSKGEQKLLQLVMACVKNPMFLVWDDPDSTLDETSFASAIEIIKRKHIAGTAVLMTTSRPGRYRELGWRVIDITGTKV